MRDFMAMDVSTVIKRRLLQVKKAVYASSSIMVCWLAVGSLFCAPMYATAFAKELNVNSATVTLPEFNRYKPDVWRNIVVCEDHKTTYIKKMRTFSKQHLDGFGFNIIDGSVPYGIHLPDSEASFIYIGGMPISEDARLCINKYSKLVSLVNEKLDGLLNPAASRVAGIPADVPVFLISRSVVSASDDLGHFDALIIACYLEEYQCTRTVLTNVFSIDIISVQNMDIFP